MALPPGNESCVEVLETSHGSSLVVTLMHVSSWPPLNWPSSAGKASMEAYLSVTSSSNDRRDMRLALHASTVYSPSGDSAKKRTLPPAT